MFDGITLEADIPDFEEWRNRYYSRPDAPEFSGSVGMESGVRNTEEYPNHRTSQQKARVGHYNATLTEIERPNGTKSVYLKIEGSLHKNHHGGANYEPFTLLHLVREIRWIEETFCLPANCFRILNLEFGVNLHVPFDVSEFIERQVLLIGPHELTPYEPKNGVMLGKTYKPAQGPEKVVKLYDKGIQNGLPFPLMRFELRYKKMRPLKSLGIQHLPDLLRPEIYPPLLEKLLHSWGKLLIAHHFAPEELLHLPAKDAELLENGCFRDFWKKEQEKGKNCFDYSRRQYRNLLLQYGPQLQTEIRELIAEEWRRLTHPIPTGIDANSKAENSAKSPATKPEANTYQKSGQNPTFSGIPVKVKGDLEQYYLPNTNTPKNCPKSVPEKLPSLYGASRVCRSCGKDISHQSERTLYCSAKFVGQQAAHRCRNAEHNRLRDMRNRAHRYVNGTLFDIALITLMPVFRLLNGGNSYRQRAP